MNRNFIKDNVTLIAIILFIAAFTFIQASKPACFYNSNGSIREFGIGYKNKTIFPVWLFSIILGILCYLVVMYYIAHPRLSHLF